MVQEHIHDVWVGSELGLLKGISLSTGTVVNYGDLKSMDKSQGITSIANVKSSDTNQVLVGLNDGSVKTFDKETLEYSPALCCGSSPVRGIVALPDGSTLTCTENGLLKHWKENECTLEKKIGSNIQTMVASSSQSLFASGGEENDLKIWKIEDMGKPVFAAKNVRNDFLNLRVPVWLSAMEFFKDSDNEIIIGSGNHNIRVYDTRVKRRPMLDVEYHDHPITALSITKGNNTVVIGNSAGYMAEVDIRTGKQVGGFKGNCGSIRDISCHVSQPYVVTCGLDRFLNIYNLSTRKVEKKIYLKSNLNCLLLTEEEIMISEEPDSRKRANEENDEEIEEGDEEEEKEVEGIWEDMQVIKEKKKKKNEHNED